MCLRIHTVSFSHAPEHILFKIDISNSSFVPNCVQDHYSYWLTEENSNGTIIVDFGCRKEFWFGPTHNHLSSNFGTFLSKNIFSWKVRHAEEHPQRKGKECVSILSNNEMSKNVVFPFKNAKFAFFQKKKTCRGTSSFEIMASDDPTFKNNGRNASKRWLFYGEISWRHCLFFRFPAMVNWRSQGTIAHRRTRWQGKKILHGLNKSEVQFCRGTSLPNSL